MTLSAVQEVAPADFADARGRVARIEAAATTAAGHPQLNDAVWRDLAEPGPGSAGLFYDEVAYVHVARADNAAPDQWVIGLVQAPQGASDEVRRLLLDGAVAHIATHGGGRAACWVLGARDTEPGLADAGFAPERELFEMRVPLPCTATAPFPTGVAVRTFDPGRDDAAWLELNNRVFAGHPEQSAWTEATLRRRLAEPWFDPAVFLLAEDARGLAGYNWMKIHGHPPLGEIFVIGIDPRAQGTGLGRALAVAGLAAAHMRGAATGSLFCSADNAPAMHLYASLGFAVHRRDRAYVRQVPAR